MFAAVLLGLVLCPAFASAAIEVIPLQNRPAAEVLPALRPVAPPDTGLSADGFRLIVRGDEAAIEEVRAVVKRLDKSVPTLRITVRRRQRSERTRGRVGIEGQSDEGIGVELDGSREIRRRGGDRTVQVRAGDTAFIDTGGVERLRRGDRYGPRHGVFPGLRQYRQGFTVRPQLIGDGRVRIEIRVNDSEPLERNGQATTSRVVTTVTGDLGDWLELSGIDQQAREGEAGLGGIRGERRTSAGGYRLRVQRAD